MNELDTPLSTEAERNDPLLDCLAILIHLHHLHYSRKALCAGLPLVDYHLTPQLFLRAAERAGFTAKIVKRPLEKISKLVLPAVLILQNNQACILQNCLDENTVTIVSPELGNNPYEKNSHDLASIYSGYAIFLQPVYQAGPKK